jgi:hypothetical protein
MTTPKDLQAKYPYMWAGPNIGISIPKGWIMIFAELCEAIDQILGDNKQGFIWTQVKEKFGAGRFYYGYGSRSSPIRIDIIGGEKVTSLTNNPRSSKPKNATDQEKRDAISKLVNEAETMTGTSCICCGALGKRINSFSWLITLCDMHEQKYRANQHALDGLIWFEDEEA